MWDFNQHVHLRIHPTFPPAPLLSLTCLISVRMSQILSSPLNIDKVEKNILRLIALQGTVDISTCCHTPCVHFRAADLFKALPGSYALPFSFSIHIQCQWEWWWLMQSLVFYQCKSWGKCSQCCTNFYKHSKQILKIRPTSHSTQASKWLGMWQVPDPPEWRC